MMMIESNFIDDKIMDKTFFSKCQLYFALLFLGFLVEKAVIWQSVDLKYKNLNVLIIFF